MSNYMVIIAFVIVGTFILALLLYDVCFLPKNPLTESIILNSKLVMVI